MHHIQISRLVRTFHSTRQPFQSSSVWPIFPWILTGQQSLYLSRLSVQRIIAAGILLGQTKKLARIFLLNSLTNTKRCKENSWKGVNSLNRLDPSDWRIGCWTSHRYLDWPTVEIDGVQRAFQRAPNTALALCHLTSLLKSVLTC